MPPGVIFLLICCVTVPGALLLAYFHARCLGWDPDDVDLMPVEGEFCDSCGVQIEIAEPVVVNSEGCWEHPYDCSKGHH